MSNKGRIAYYIISLAELSMLYLFIAVFLKNYFVNSLGLTQEQVSQVIIMIFVVCILVAIAIGILELVRKHFRLK